MQELVHPLPILVLHNDRDGAVLGAPAGDQPIHTERAGNAAVRVGVAERQLGVPPGPTALVPHGRYCFEQREATGDIVALPPVSRPRGGRVWRQ
ncbi:hypothetical protein [Streptomyces sp. NBC_01497]|uniref:hypothetical protein n=1 Tax=Streptomyces sp. NBC_01497 TaxID=2903885 RepID=UPI003FCE06F3